jgi:hypothetical protein
MPYDWTADSSDSKLSTSSIYLPQWLARHNKTLFGSLFVLNELIVLWQWLG